MYGYANEILGFYNYYTHVVLTLSCTDALYKIIIIQPQNNHLCHDRLISAYFDIFKIKQLMTATAGYAQKFETLSSDWLKV